MSERFTLGAVGEGGRGRGIGFSVFADVGKFYGRALVGEDGGLLLLEVEIGRAHV